jgi:hypothetical protein
MEYGFGGNSNQLDTFNVCEFMHDACRWKDLITTIDHAFYVR